MAALRSSSKPPIGARKTLELAGIFLFVKGAFVVFVSAGFASGLFASLFWVSWANAARLKTIANRITIAFLMESPLGCGYSPQKQSVSNSLVFSDRLIQMLANGFSGALLASYGVSFVHGIGEHNCPGFNLRHVDAGLF